ncbi:MAG TPA: hypothetical protein VFG21_08700 [Xanthomonadaceae bacterium]|nr:hypothetical protein [Xanthomonadaceae bacterium]
MNIRNLLSTVLLALVGTVCTQAAANGPPHSTASGVFTQTGINSLDVQFAGPNTIIEQTSEGSVIGTLSGSYEDAIRVVIHPSGKFNAKFTIVCDCTVDGKQGFLYLVATDTGELVSDTQAIFSGRAVITGGTGELSGLRGVLQIEGTVDVATGLSEYDYVGWVH